MTRHRTMTKYIECDECGEVEPIHRVCGRDRKKNHTKHFYCYKCKKRTPHTEIGKYKI